MVLIGGTSSPLAADRHRPAARVDSMAHVLHEPVAVDSFTESRQVDFATGHDVEAARQRDLERASCASNPFRRGLRDGLRFGLAGCWSGRARTALLC